MGADVVLDDFGHQAGHRAARAGEQVHDLFAAGLAVEGTLDGLDLTADAADAGQELLLFTDGVGHLGLIA
jgi:hypothetical protein